MHCIYNNDDDTKNKTEKRGEKNKGEKGEERNSSGTRRRMWGKEEKEKDYAYFFQFLWMIK